MTVFSVSGETLVDPALFLSRSRNTPFTGRRLRGAPVMTIVAGEVVWGGSGRPSS